MTQHTRLWQFNYCPPCVPFPVPVWYNIIIFNKRTKRILRQLGSNQTELSLNNGNSIFFSYETPVAGFDSEDGFFKTETYYSKTTSRHINQYFKHVDAGDISIVPDEYIVNLVNYDVK